MVKSNNLKAFSSAATVDHLMTAVRSELRKSVSSWWVAYDKAEVESPVKCVQELYNNFHHTRMQHNRKMFSHLLGQQLVDYKMPVIQLTMNAPRMANIT